MVVRFPAGPQVSLKCGDQSKDNGAGHKKKRTEKDRSNHAVTFKPRYSSLNQYSLRNIKER